MPKKLPILTPLETCVPEKVRVLTPFGVKSGHCNGTLKEGVKSGHFPSPVHSTVVIFRKNQKFKKRQNNSILTFLRARMFCLEKLGLATSETKFSDTRVFEKM